MAQWQLRALNENDILACLNNSEIEDDELDFPDDGVDDEYSPTNREESQESPSDTSSEDDLPLQHLRGRGRTHGEAVGVGRSRRGVNSRSRSSRGRNRLSRSTHSRTGNILNLQTRGSREWLKKDFASPIGYLSEPSYVPIDCSEFTDEQYFEQYIDDDLISMIFEKSNQMQIFKTGNSLDLTEKECKIYVALTMMMSCINYPYIRMYWEQKWRIAFIADAMTRNRYFQLRTSLKLVFDPDISQEEKSRDKLWKVRPLINRFLQGCHKQVREQHISIDEMIIPFSGSCGIKQYCPNKPNPVGLKAFVLANPDDTVCDITIYQGETTFVEETAAGFGLGESAVLNLTRTLVPGHILYFDRYITSLKLAQKLSNRGFKCAGTVMKNRIPNSLRNELPADRDMKHQGRGSSSVFVNADDTVAFTKWFDNKPVLLMSIVYGSEPTDECRRWSKNDKRYIHIQRPVVVKIYNSKMGGVDLADRMLAVCPSRARTNKWTIRFISHMVDLGVSNAWIQFRKTESQKGVPIKKILSLHPWKMRLAENILDKNLLEQDQARAESEEDEEPERKRGRPAVIQRLGQHLPIFVGVPNKAAVKELLQNVVLVT